MSKQKRNLLIVAHPDDETLFFAGAIMQMKSHPWHVICVTDGNADGQGKERKAQFTQACRKLGAKYIEQLDLPDIYEKRLDVQKITAHLSTLDKPQVVFTHGPIGEYGHPHHQDVSWAVHDFYLKNKIKVWAPAYNCLAQKQIHLTKSEFKKKTEILSKIYFNETKRLIQHLPATSVECYAQFKHSEVKAIYAYLTGAEPLALNKLSLYKWHTSYFENIKQAKRPF